MSDRIFHVDAFTRQPFAGNPAAVCLLSKPRPAEWMQGMAREMNLSETAFISPLPDGFSLRWFTPLVEVELCGHATLAGAHILWEGGGLPLDKPARFFTRSGLLEVRRDGDWIEMAFPAWDEEPAELPEGYAQALRVNPEYVGRTTGNRYVIEVAAEAVVRSLQPDFDALRRLPGRAVAVTSRSATSGVDFVSRYFAPWVGINEDPVTGSIHCCLGAFWGRRLGKAELVACQVSARGGELRLRVSTERVFIQGQAVTITSGALHA